VTSRRHGGYYCPVNSPHWRPGDRFELHGVRHRLLAPADGVDAHTHFVEGYRAVRAWLVTDDAGDTRVVPWEFLNYARDLNRLEPS